MLLLGSLPYFLMHLLTAIPFQDNTSLIDNSETVHISSLALLKMLRHGRAGVPMEVMGLMLGEFVDDFTVRVVDVFAMPQSGTGVSVEAVDPVFQMKMMDMLRQTGRYAFPHGSAAVILGS
jgi:26S proteasome regulatory subunit N11